MVKAFHDAGIKVLVDVVYNHTGEGGPQGDKNTYNVFSWRGLDNPTYYSLTSDRQSPWDNTGVGGNYNTFNPVAQNLIVDSVAYWKNTLGVDGFRFDLASVLGNTCQHGCFNYSRTNTGNRAQPPRRRDARRARRAVGPVSTGSPNRGPSAATATRWATSPPAGRSGTASTATPSVATRTRWASTRSPRPTSPTASPGRPTCTATTAASPWHSVNFMVAHDGFTLKDLYACNSKNNNQPWPYGPSDGGSDDNISWDQGGVAADQRKAARNGHAFLMLSAGMPMMTGGDEYLRTHQLQQQSVQPRLQRQLAGLDRRHRPDELPDLHQPADRLPQGAPRAAAGELLHRRRHQRQRAGAARLVHPGGHRTGLRLLGQREQPRDRLAHRRQRVRRHRVSDLRRLQRLVRRRDLHPARTARRQAVVPGHRHLHLGRRTQPGSQPGRRGPHRRRLHHVHPACPRTAPAHRQIDPHSSSLLG